VVPAVLEHALGAVQVRGPKEDEPLFSASEAALLAKALAEALAVAGPGEDLEVLSTAKRATDVVGESLSVAARAFVADGGLNLIVHDARKDYLFQYYANYQVPDLQYGSRTRAAKVELKAPGAVSPRPDWVILSLAGAPPAPAHAPVPVAASVPPPAPSTASVEERLTGLKRFRDLGLITEEEYAKKKEEILKSY